MKIFEKKGFALAMAIYFIILAAITSIALYAYAMYIYEEAGISAPRSAKGYYLALAGVRYAYILLSDPATVTNLGFIPDNPDGTEVTLNGSYNNGNIQVTFNNDKGRLIQDPYYIQFLSDIWTDTDPVFPPDNPSPNAKLTITIKQFDNPASTPWLNGQYEVTADYDT